MRVLDCRAPLTCRRVAAILTSIILITWMLILQIWSFHDAAGSDGKGKVSPSIDDAKSEVKHPENPEGLARYLPPKELLARPLTHKPEAMPRLIHQSWKSTELPAKFEKWSATCRKMHPDWEWVLWTDEDNLALVQTHFPWLEETFRALPGEIFRADLSRNLYLYIYGGVYADLDMECLRPTEAILEKYHIAYNANGSVHNGDASFEQMALVGHMGPDYEFEHSIPNAWMASSPGHPLWLLALEYLQNRSASLPSRLWDYFLPSAERMTGPIALRQSIFKYVGDRIRFSTRLSDGISELVQKGPWAKWWDTQHDILILPTDVIYPYSYHTDDDHARDVCWVLSAKYNPDECKEYLRVEEKGSIVITYWSHSHHVTTSDKKNLRKLSEDNYDV